MSAAAAAWIAAAVAERCPNGGLCMDPFHDWLGLQFVDLPVERLAPRVGPLVVAVDGTLFRRSGRQVSGARWAHDGSAATRRAVSFGTRGWWPA